MENYFTEKYDSLCNLWLDKLKFYSKCTFMPKVIFKVADLTEDVYPIQFLQSLKQFLKFF